TPVAAQPVDREDLVRGVELPGGDLVTVSDEELYSIAPERSRTIEIEEFVDLAEIDPVFYEKSYHVAPVRGRGAEKPYMLLQRAMKGAGMVGIGRFVLRTKPHLVAIRPRGGALALETLFFGDEVRDARRLIGDVEAVGVSEPESELAEKLIETLKTTWDPNAYSDTYREELLERIAQKEPGQIPEERAGAPAGSQAEALMNALKASVQEAKKRQTKRSARKRTA